VTHPRVRFIAFTGSKEVGLRIKELASKAQPGQIWIKRAILEMEARTPLSSTKKLIWTRRRPESSLRLRFQGQKCSACSRAIVHADVYDAFLDRLKKFTETSVRLGSVEEADVNFGLS